SVFYRPRQPVLKCAGDAPRWGGAPECGGTLILHNNCNGGRHPGAVCAKKRLEMEVEARNQALIALGQQLQTAGYRFATVTPTSHLRVNGRPGNASANSLQAVFGWNRPFRRDELPPRIVALLEEAEELEVSDDLLRSKI